MFQQIRDFFKTQGWVFSTIEDKSIAILGVSGKNGQFQCVANVIEEEQKFIFWSICGANVPTDKKKEMSELLTRLNFGKFLGNFEMDYEDGEIRYKTSIYYSDLKLTNAIIENMVLTNMESMDRALEGIMELIYGNITALEAYNSIIEDSTDE